MMDQQASGRPYDAVVFDLDGTLIDSAPDIRASLNKVLAEDGLPPLALPLVTSFIGNGVARLVARAYRHLDAKLGADDLQAAVLRFSDIYTKNAAVLTRPFPGVIDGLDALTRDGVRLGVCTNKPRAISERILGELGLAPFFDVVIGGDSCARKKPDPAPLLACLEALGAAPARGIFIGDSETDVLTARRAGVRIIAVTYGYAAAAPADLAADEVIARIDRWALSAAETSGWVSDDPAADRCGR